LPPAQPTQEPPGEEGGVYASSPPDFPEECEHSDMSFRVFADPQAGQGGAAVSKMSSSNSCPHFVQMYSKIGIFVPHLTG
jgi:hypothetical protein